jgi:hypothetical protein
MRGSGWLVLVVRAAGTLVLGALAWAVLGFLATAPLGAIYGWSGHPSIPAAPEAIYIGLYLLVLPLICLSAAWFLLGFLIRLFSRRTGT